MIYDLGVVAAIIHAFENVGVKGCEHAWVKPTTCIDCAAHYLLWRAGFKAQGW
jgi:hypothetical protein